ncbi:DNA binding [Microdochium nivale]|nr:DNA binding [Microdochium nivale]
MGMRKSCDICTLKKIKCNGQVPRCSRCVDDGTPCSWTPGIHKRVRAAPQHRQSNCVVKSRTAKPLLQLESRLSELEAEVKRLKALNANAPATPSVPRSSSERSSPIDIMQDRKSRNLPSFEQAKIIAGSYFSGFNTYFPLFDRPAFFRMLQDCYDSPAGGCEDAAWAAVSIVLALGLQDQPRYLAAHTRDDETRYLSNVRSVLDSLITRAEDLKGIQVLLGLILYTQRSSDPHAAPYLVASAVKLAYRLGLHVSSSGAAHVGSQASAARNRLLWIVYILDRDSSMSQGDPYMLQDHDIAIDMPDLLVDVFAVSPQMTILPHGAAMPGAFLRCRIGLAQIQGQVYDSIYSVRAAILTLQQRIAALDAIWGMLRQWSAALPSYFGHDSLHGLLSACTATSATAEQVIWLYFAYFRTICLAHRVHCHNTEWIRSLVAYSTRWTLEFDLANAAGEENPLPAASHWTEIVATARRCMALFHHGRAAAGGSRVCELDEVCCAYVAALVILVGHKLTVMDRHHDPCLRLPQQQQLRLASGDDRGDECADMSAGNDGDGGGDDMLITAGIERLRALPETYITRKYDLYRSIAGACQELNVRADAARDAYEYMVLHFSGSAAG